MMKHYADASGNYLGGFDVPPNSPPPGGLEVADAPPHIETYTWNFGASAWERDADGDDKDANREIAGDFEDNRVKRLLFEINFNQENRIRVLEGAPTITKAQYKAALVNRLKTL